MDKMPLYMEMEFKKSIKSGWIWSLPPKEINVLLIMIRMHYDFAKPRGGRDLFQDYELPNVIKKGVGCTHVEIQIDSKGHLFVHKRGNQKFTDKGSLIRNFVTI
jgi:hypothetical protein